MPNLSRGVATTIDPCKRFSVVVLSFWPFLLGRQKGVKKTGFSPETETSKMSQNNLLDNYNCKSIPLPQKIREIRKINPTGAKFFALRFRRLLLPRNDWTVIMAVFLYLFSTEKKPRAAILSWFVFLYRIM